MTAASRPWAREILRVWFHELGSGDWYGGGPEVDALLRRRFAKDLARLGNRPACEFLTEPKTALAAVLLFDQIPRNLYRDDTRAYAYDPLALAICHGILRAGWLPRFDRDERQFALMPLMHSEDIVDQRLAVSLFAKYAPAASPFARSHYKMIARFGRFPHRNAVLGRTSSEEEKRAIAAGFSW
ncbi:DUF924 domain-containing protein [Erythrobacter litoralis]|uniref:DUF924 family protein n=1 Tax=Erythrobacter litoralis TaxID=39960 RepID=UPI0024353FF9|nr:DUF924 domain-containing protein [Erythrobacter litoralis]MDG6080083.1 DUF924 domain-containing protein [Erythrobacter litoralis]